VFTCVFENSDAYAALSFAMRALFYVCSKFLLGSLIPFAELEGFMRHPLETGFKEDPVWYLFLELSML
jgi:hypothetical protein